MDIPATVSIVKVSVLYLIYPRYFSDILQILVTVYSNLEIRKKYLSYFNLLARKKYWFFIDRIRL